MKIALALAAVAALALSGCLSAQRVSPQGAGAPDVAKLAQKTVAYTASGKLLRDVAGNLTVPTIATFDTGGHGGEPTLGVTKSGAVYVTAGDDIMRSADGGRTWKVSYEFGPPTGLPRVPNAAGV